MAVEMGVLELGQKDSRFYDDDGRPKRRGTVWTASAHIITAVIGSGVLTLAWAIAQLGWVVGPIAMVIFSLVTCFTSTLLADCYRSGDPVAGKRNYTYMDAVRSNLGGVKVKMCGLIQYLNLFGVAIGYTIAASIILMAINRANCFHHHNKGGGFSYNGDKDIHCGASSNLYMITFGVFQILLSQIPDFDRIWWLSIVAAVMSFTYSLIGLILGALLLTSNGSAASQKNVQSSTSMNEKLWHGCQAAGNIAFAYSYSVVLIEIQDTVRAPPPRSEATLLKR